MSSNPLNYITTSALSIVLSGNTGVAPFVTLFITGLIGRSNPDLLALQGTTQMLLSSWWALTIWGVLTVLEFVGKCVPLIDAMIDSVETFVIPFLSILASCSSFGLFDVAQAATDAGAIPGDVLPSTAQRRLNVLNGFIIFVQVILVLIGMVLALLVHLFKLLVRLLGVGWLTCCITILEYTWIILTLCLAIFIKPIAIVVAICLIGYAAMGFLKRQKIREETNAFGGGRRPERPDDDGLGPIGGGTTTTVTTTPAAATPAQATEVTATSVATGDAAAATPPTAEVIEVTPLAKEEDEEIGVTATTSTDNTATTSSAVEPSAPPEDQVKGTR